MEPCKNCGCGCVPVSAECIVKYSEIPNFSLVMPQHLENAVLDIDDLIGIRCAESLCAALKTAVEEANAGGGKPEDYLSDKWKQVVENRHFKHWFANRVAFHWFEGSSITQLSEAGLVTASNSDSGYKNNFTQAEESQRKRLSDNAAERASNSRTKFLEGFWFCNTCNYEDCLPACECRLLTCKRCNPDGSGGRGQSIGFVIV